MRITLRRCKPPTSQEPSRQFSSARLRVARVIVVYVAAVVFLAALIAPWVFQPFHAREMNRWRTEHPAGDVARTTPFGRVFNRVVLAVAIAGLWPALRAMGLRSWRDLGYPSTRCWRRDILVGVLLGMTSLAVAGGVLIVVGARTLNLHTGPGRSAVLLCGFAATALVVAAVEETLFRGGLQGALQRAMKPLAAIALTSAVYSAAHFLKSPRVGIPADAVAWYSGFDHLGRVLSQSWRDPGVGLGFVTLWLAGFILGYAFAETKALYLPLGLHAGWVFTLKSFALCTQTQIRRTTVWWGGGALIENVLIWPVLLVLFAVVYWLCRNRHTPVR